MSDRFVLVHGAWHGGWCWRRVAPLLRDAGHEVFTPTLTGLGERAHLLGPDVGPDTHVQDVVGVLDAEELTDVVLVGHSFGALVALAVAGRTPERVRRVVLLDGLVVEPGQVGYDGLPPEAAAARRDAAEATGDTAFPPPGGAAFGLADPEDIAWVERRLTPHPVRTYAEPFPLARPLGGGRPVTYVACTDPAYPAVHSAHAIARREGWAFRELASGHDAMVAAPEATAELLMSS
ncbi:MAG TPA: alpha/beta hydrolase [Pseudonocardia sp.]|uniref:alpha/beta fold hydrolase n=1 Tax=Pseudonocardia sp. TaxID=60912 RepID=UPI002B4B0A5D|nr:alpha/beta hydrolase [Pseudonocardia sp.]HLU54427.1 alpha/beta hydrolase [Pseudonocardia sp.]